MQKQNIDLINTRIDHEIGSKDSIAVNGYFSVSGGAVGPFNSSSFSWQHEVSWIHGSHNIAIGGSLQKTRVDLGDLLQSPGAFTFTADQVGDALAGFMIGKVRTFNQGAGEFKNNRNLFPAFYATDTCHATHRFTLTYGVRYKPYFPWNEIQGRVEQFSIRNYSAGVRSQVYPNAPPGLLPGRRRNAFQGYHWIDEEFRSACRVCLWSDR